jgi:hypothetical protein
MIEEIWKDIPGYEGIYQVSDLGRVKSFKLNREKILKLGVDRGGYLGLTLCNEGKIRKTKKVHQLVAMTFLNHEPGGYKLVVDHKNNDKQDNRLENLQLVSQRENSSKDKNGSSKYTGVSWDKQRSKWKSSIQINGKLKYLGYFDLEEEAGEYYQDALKSLENNTEIKVKEVVFSSKYKGVTWHKQNEKWISQITINGKSKNLGRFNCELEAHHAYQKKLAEISK